MASLRPVVRRVYRPGRSRRSAPDQSLTLNGPASSLRAAMEAFFLIGILLVLVGPVLAIVAFVRTQAIGELRKAVDALEAEGAELRRRVRLVAAPPAAAAPPA